MAERLINTTIGWSLAQIWNEVAFKPNKELTKRDYIYASEIGMPFVDRWLKMKAVPFTNPPNSRSQRKFLAGNLMEFVTKQILIAAGIYKHDEIKVDACPYNGCLEIHGRLDFKAGGYVNADESLERLKSLNLPDYLSVIGEKIISELAGRELEEKILELKSVSSFAFEKVEKTKKALPHHSLQGYHYQKNGLLPADVCYICKDDCRMLQFGINEDETEPIYKQDIEEMTQLFKSKKRPPAAPGTVFDYLMGRFSKNLYVEYSPYLTYVYGFQNPDEFRLSVAYVDKWNRALTRFAQAEMGKTTPTGKPITITAKNNEIKAEIIKAGYDFTELLECKINIGTDNEDETDT